MARIAMPDWGTEERRRLRAPTLLLRAVKGAMQGAQQLDCCGTALAVSITHCTRTANRRMNHCTTHGCVTKQTHKTNSCVSPCLRFAKTTSGGNAAVIIVRRSASPVDGSITSR